MKSMKPIAFIDTEIEPKSKRILDIGGVKWNGSSFHSNSVIHFIKFLNGSEFICGHTDLLKPILEHPVELAYCLALIHAWEAAFTVIRHWIFTGD